jgi:3-oxoacyl-[acyl-carrier protein] reductase
MSECKVAVVTGASRGIGKAIAEMLASSGMKVVICYNESAALAEETAAKTGGIPLQVDVRSSESVTGLFDRVAACFGGTDILVNNAGAFLDKPFLDTSPAEIDDILQTNLYGAFYCSKQAAKQMIKKRYGKIVNITSACAFTSSKGLAVYSASKGALVSLTKSLAKELMSRNICVNAVAPGLTDTDMSSVYSAEVKKKLLGPVKREGTVQDIANAVYFLLQPESDYITGQTIHVNGGTYL